MNGNHQARLMQLFELAADLPATEQAAFVAEHCGDNAELASRLQSLLAHDARQATALDDVDPQALTNVLREAVPSAILDNQVVGAYRVERLIGTGGMGRVYLARHLDVDTEHRVAIKFVRPDRLEPNVLARFSREWRVLASLQHPGISTFVDTGALADGTPYVVMEYVEGEPLFDYCRDRNLGVRNRLQLLRKVVAAVAHAHSRLVVHRDIKASNVLVNADGEVKLLDFGIAKSLSEVDNSMTATSERFLTPINAAPELLHGEPTGTGCDIYALGVLAYELLSGHPPLKFDGLLGAQIERLILSVPPPPMSQLVAGDDDAAHERGLENGAELARRLRGDLDAIVSRCLRKSPSDRYVTALELDADIERHLEQLPIRARHGDRLYRFGRLVARHRVAVTLSAALLASLLGSTIISALQSAELARQRNLAVIERDHAQQVVQVLRDAFQYADPARAAGDEVSARQILDAARPRLDGLADSQPRQFALLADTLSGVELALGAEAQAAELAQRGLAAIEVDNHDPSLLRRLRLTTARALTGVGDLERAEALLEEVRRSDNVLQPDWAVARARLAINRLPESEMAIDLLRQAEAMILDHPADDELATDVRWQLAEALRINHRYGEALTVLDAMLHWQQAQLEEDHPRIVLTRLRRFAVMAAGEIDEARLPELKAVAEQLIQYYGEDSSMAGTVRNIFGNTLRAAGHTDASIGQFRLAWNAWRRSLGDDHANTLRLGANLAIALAEQPGSQDEAMDMFREIMPHAEKRFGAQRPMTVYLRSQWARLLGSKGLWRDALTVMAQIDADLAPDDRGSPTSRAFQASVLSQVLAENHCHRFNGNDAVSAACENAAEQLRRLQSGE